MYPVFEKQTNCLMNIYPLVFSNNNNYRITRHAIFWLIWILYYTIFSTYNSSPNFPLANRFFALLIEVALSTPLDMIFCYFIIYYLLPKFLFRGRYISMLLLWLIASLVFITVFEIYVQQVVPHIKEWFNLPKPKPMNYSYEYFSLFSQINMEGCIAASIKLGKLSFIKQKEIDLLKNEKIRLESRTGNADIEPVFLADIIARVELMATKHAANVPDVLKRIRNLMVNIIYENTNAKVGLKKEIELVKEYIELEKYTREDLINVELNVSGNIESESIASLLLLQCIQNAFKQVSVLDIADKEIDIDIKVINKMLEILISWNKPLYTSTLTEGKNVILQNLNNRLKLIYPESHEIKVLIEVDKIIVCLKIDLKGAIN
jgi:hypothetical protein